MAGQHVRVLIRRRTPAPPPAPDDPVLAYALTDLDWYARTRDGARRWHWTTELGALSAGSATVVAAGIQAPAAVTATVAGIAVFIGGFRQVFNHTERYVLAAESWSRLRPAVERYRLLPEDERDADARRVLVEAIEAVSAAEIQSWAVHRRGARSGSDAGPGIG
ncbi:SLATT domain-containing protein [Streptomyces sp. SID13666]|nr:SLATT domain-containing protein [Streptomyces sp. SID13666]NEA70864.1 SLATT domain-containing protein [Streptomyces sp. SID13588]